MAQATAHSKHTVALLTYIGLLPLVYYIPPTISSWLTGSVLDHKLAITLISVTAIVPIISYLYLPLALKLLSKRYF
jgi:antibiotic biosynthesis monooxygenase (ABM) superfamily enzyme